jgi:predicted NBD/HSP70 family sugar kinase
VGCAEHFAVPKRVFCSKKEINKQFRLNELDSSAVVARRGAKTGNHMKQRKTYIRSIDAVFGNTDAHNEVPDLIESGWLERREGRLAFGSSCGDAIGLSIERETLSWAVLGPRGSIASHTLDVPIAPIGGSPVSRARMEEILVAALREVATLLPKRPIAGVGVAWPRPIALDGEPYDDGFVGSTAAMGERFSPREVVRDAMAAAGIAAAIGEGGEPIVEIVNDADADLLYDARLGAGRGIGSLLGLKICGGIGLSLVHHGRLVRGHAGRAGEIEHIKVRFEDFPLPDRWDNVRELDELPPCSCNGANCIARFATGKTLIDQLCDYDDPSTSYTERGRQVEAGSRRDVVTAVFGRGGRLLGQALQGPVLAFDPERIVVSAFPKNASLLQGLRTGLTDGTRVHLDPDDIVFASPKRERTAAGAGWLVVEQDVIPRMEEAVANGGASLRRHELPYWLRSQVPSRDLDVNVFGPPYSPSRAPELIAE